MRRNTISLEEVKNKIRDLKGQYISMAINRGRKKIDYFNAVIDNIYPSVFTVKVNAVNQLDTQTFSYFDVLCGDVEIEKISGA
ncbi:MAG: Veg family protein [Firmicutes bacterium]|nr:Veg family protein [Bacillota bacterium]MDY3659123.1 Veg family protein [Eubacteriales bacterium]